MNFVQFNCSNRITHTHTHTHTHSNHAHVESTAHLKLKVETSENNVAMYQSQLSALTTKLSDSKTQFNCSNRITHTHTHTHTHSNHAHVESTAHLKLKVETSENNVAMYQSQLSALTTKLSDSKTYLTLLESAKTQIISLQTQNSNLESQLMAAGESHSVSARLEEDDNTSHF